MIKVFCIFGAMAAAFLIGVTESWRLRLRVKQLERVLLFLQQMEEEIRYTANPIAEIIDTHKEKMEILDFCFRELGSGKNFTEAWRSAIEVEGTRLTKADRQYLLEFGTGFGSMDREGQINACRLTEERLNFQLTAAKKDVEQKAKLYRSLGVLSSAGILLAAV